MIYYFLISALAAASVALVIELTCKQTQEAFVALSVLLLLVIVMLLTMLATRNLWL